MAKPNKNSVAAILIFVGSFVCTPLAAQSSGSTREITTYIIENVADEDQIGDFIDALPESKYDAVLEDVFYSSHYHRRSWVTAYRVYNRKRVDRRRVQEIAAQGRADFAVECAAKGGFVEPDTSTALYDSTLERLGLITGHSKMMSICLRSPDEPLGMFISWRFETSWSYRFVILAISPEAIATDSMRAAQAAREMEREEEALQRLANERRQAEEFQRNIAIGTETNCGPVIQIRGPMAEVAVPVNRRVPNGEPTFWSRKERLFPAGYGVCTYGL